MIAEIPAPGRPIDGGVQAVTSCLVQAILRLPDIELHVIQFLKGISAATQVRRDGYLLHTLPIARLGTLTGFWRDQQALDACLASIDPDLVHSQGAGHLGILARRTKYPSIVTVHGILAEEIQYEPGLRERLRLGLQSRLNDRVCIRNGRHTILISQYVADYYGERLGGQKYLVPNPVDDHFFDIERHETPGKILFAGRVTERKGVSDLLAALGTLDTTAHVTLAGSLADRAYVDRVRALTQRLGIEQRVHFAGLLDLERLKQELAECSCLALPSYQETAPMVIQEALAAGVPVVATAICGVPYQVEHGETGFVYPPGDIAALAGHLSELLADPALRARFGQQAREFARKNYSATAVAAETARIYAKVARSVSQQR
jgi:glycosyltransferase involved in cell wall biosynthesis